MNLVRREAMVRRRAGAVLVLGNGLVALSVTGAIEARPHLTLLVWVGCETVAS